jgi:DMSO/TMAO reductase YedYZ molybdopterin-dependent catalytic subunit
MRCGPAGRFVERHLAPSVFWADFIHCRRKFHLQPARIVISALTRERQPAIGRKPGSRVIPTTQGHPMQRSTFLPAHLPRRRFLARVGGIGLTGLLGASAWDAMAATPVELPFANGRRELATNFPQKGAMLLQRTRPPLLETPFEVFDQGVFTPNDRFYVRWHLANIPEIIDPATFRLNIHGHVREAISLTLDDLVRDFESFEIAAVNQCSGNSRGFFGPRVAGGQWANGAMGNARWKGVRLKDVLDRAGVKAGALQARFNGLDTGALPQTPDFMKSLSIDHARDGEVMIAYAMNGEPLPLLNGFPLRLVVPGWYATYWVKMLDDIEVLDKPDDNFWTTKAYLIPDTPLANILPGQKGVKMIPINRMVPRSFFTNIQDGAVLKVGQTTTVRGIAFGGDAGLAKVLFSSDAGRLWQETRLGPDQGKYGFRQWEVQLRLPSRGPHKWMIKAFNTAGSAQPDRPNWNGAGFMRNVVESVSVQAV